MSLSTEKKAAIVAEFGRDAKDTGSSDRKSTRLNSSHAT